MGFAFCRSFFVRTVCLRFSVLIGETIFVLTECSGIDEDTFYSGGSVCRSEKDNRERSVECETDVTVLDWNTDVGDD